MMSEISSLAPQQLPSSIDLTTADLAGPFDPSQSLRHNPWRYYEESQLGSLWFGWLPGWWFRLGWWLSPGEKTVAVLGTLAAAGGFGWAVATPNSEAKTGEVAEWMLVASLGLLVCGVRTDDAVFLHRLFAWLGVVTAGLHGFVGVWLYGDTLRVWKVEALRGSGVEASMTGGWALAALCLLALAAAPPLRRWLYTVFLLSHRVAGVGFVGLAWLHGARAISLAGLIFFFWAGLRRWLAGNRCKILNDFRARVIEDSGVVELSWSSNNLHFSPGQYFLLEVGGLSRWVSKPFFAASAPGEPRLRLLIARRGHWTRRLKDAAATNGLGPLSAGLRGPYGSPGVDLEGRGVRVVLLVAGGAGAGVIRGFAANFLRQIRRGRPIFRVFLVWSAKSHRVIRAVLPAEDEIFKESEGVLMPRFHVTSGSIPHSENDDFRTGRIDFRGLIDEVEADTVQFKEKVVGFVCCGPNGMLKDLKKEIRGRKIEFRGWGPRFEW